MAELQFYTSTFASLALCWTVGCYDGPADPSGDPVFTGGSVPTEDGAANSDGSETDDGSEMDDGPDPSDIPGRAIADLATDPVDPIDEVPPLDEEGCHAIYAQDLLPTFELTIHPVVWDELNTMWNKGDDFKGDPKKYLPLQEFRYDDIVIENAEIRLRGNATHWDPPPGDKLQFQIGFHRNDPDGNFLGIKRMMFDAHTANEHMLRDRLSLAVMREVGITAPCANNARVVINGEYYGIFTNIEKIDEVFLERVMEDPTGDLWKRHGWQLKTNKDSYDDERLEALKDAESTEEVYAYFEFEQALRVYATDAVLPNGDGTWGGGLNFYLYDHPIDKKFWLLPYDMDNTFERFNDEPGGDFPINPDPVVWQRKTSHGRPWYDAAIDDDMWFEHYISLISEVLYTAYRPEKMHAQIDEMSAQIEDAVLEDENKPWSNERYFDEVEELHEHVESRYEFVSEWLECWEDGGEKDKKGYCDGD